MYSERRSAEQTALGKQIDLALGEEEGKLVLQDLAMVIAKHNLVHKTEVCELLFRYMVFVTKGWNAV